MVVVCNEETTRRLIALIIFIIDFDIIIYTFVFYVI